MNICLIAPFFSGSHRRWAEEYAKYSQHTVQLLTLPGRHWKWRMHGAAVSFARQLKAMEEVPDLILTTDMLDVATFRGLLGSGYRRIPLAVYFHENQLTYPWSPTDEDVSLQRDRHYAWLNYTTCLAADRVFFNSNYHRQSFLEALPDFLRVFPDHQEQDLVEQIAEKSASLHLGMELSNQLDTKEVYPPNEVPIILWNHRWEYDKDPDAFFRLCYRLDKEGLAFELVVLGEQYRQSPLIFKEAQDRLAHRIIQWGFAEDKAAYWQWLQRADLLPVTSRQDFFGGSVVEAMYANVYPLLPNRLAYPEHVPLAQQDQHLYADEDEFFEKVSQLLQGPDQFRKRDFRPWGACYDWDRMAKQYDESLAALVHHF